MDNSNLTTKALSLRRQNKNAVVLNKRSFLSPHKQIFILLDVYGMEYLILANSSSGERGHTTRR